MVQRLICTFSLLLALVCPAFSQFEIGANLGASVSVSHLDPLGRDVSPLSGIYPELRAGYLFNDWLSANLGVGFAQRGFKEQPEGEAARKVRLRYFQVPIYAGARYPLCNKVSVAASFGLQLNFFNSSDAPAPFNIDYQEMHNPLAFLCGAECGYDLFKDVRLNLQYRYTADFVYADRYESLGRLSANWIMLGVTYTLRPKTAEVHPIEGALSSIW